MIFENTLFILVILFGLAQIISSLAIGIFFLLLLITISNSFQSFTEQVIGRPLMVHFEFKLKKLDPKSELLLLKHFPYYKNLKGHKKLIFSHRVAHFIKEKHFRIDKQVKDENLVKILIAATAAKVTFGLHNYLFSSFHTIVVHPESYYSRLSKSVNLGEASSLGFIAFSWKDFLFGYNDDNDSYNLAYHEFGHALQIEYLKYSMDSVFSKYFEKWTRYVKDYSKLIEVKEKYIFREYASHNLNEFFAVSVENFFEKPKEFKENLPQLYFLMAKMLNQDPLKRKMIS